VVSSSCLGKSCGPWSTLNARGRPAEWLCEGCERAFEAEGRVFVFTDQRQHIATLLSDRGLRLARNDAIQERAA